MKPEDFVVFILSNGRPDKVFTHGTLRRSGYTGRIVILVDNEDPTAELYLKNYGEDDVIIFDKKAMADMTDEGDNFDDRRTTTHVRNASFEVAKQLGITYFIQLDDDYTFFAYNFTPVTRYFVRVQIRNMDAVFAALLDFYKSTPLLSLAFIQGGDMMGGSNGSMVNAIKTRRKAMNSFICSTERPFQFISRLNEDVNTYITLGSRGGLFLTVNQVSLCQRTTQNTEGGMSESYLDYGTYVKSFYSVMYQPSSVKVHELGTTDRRIHHKISWNNTVPKIIAEGYKKVNSETQTQ